MLFSLSEMIGVPGGEYRPLYLSKDSPKQRVETFMIDVLPVTNGQFFDFVQANPRWQPHKVATIFAESQYLHHWPKSGSTWAPSQQQLTSPVTQVSWFAANAYCQGQNKKLPTVAQWERVASASDTQANGQIEAGYKQKILTWYSRPNSAQLPGVGLNNANFWGVHDLHGLIWEWTDDFNSSLVSGESRGDSTIDQRLYCAAGASGAADPSDYAAFMRFAFRSSLKAQFTLPNLGYRCASSKDQPNAKS